MPAAAAPGGHVCNVVVCRTTVILASSAPPSAASTTAAPMLRGHLPHQVAMTPTMMIPSPLASACPECCCRHRCHCRHCRRRHLCDAQGLGLYPLVANVKAMHAQEAGKGGKVRNQKCQAKYARITNSWMPEVMDQDLRRAKAWLANCQPLVGMMARLLLPACCRRPVIVVMTGASR